jgi:hypothetical protein
MVDALALEAYVGFSWLVFAESRRYCPTHRGSRAHARGNAVANPGVSLLSGYPMKPRSISWLLPSVVLAAATASCATGGSFSQLTARRTRLVALDTTLTAVGRFPSSRVIADDAELVTFWLKGPGPLWQHRDTLRGPADVSGWLEQWRASQLPAVDFFLTPNDLRVCDGLAIQYGSYPIRERVTEGPVESRSYRALWRRGADGGWRLERLWLAPDAKARLPAGASGCRSLRATMGATRRWVVEADVLWAGRPVSRGAVDAMRNAGWIFYRPPNLGGATPYDFPYALTNQIGFAAGVTYRVTPLWGLEGLYLQSPHEVARGFIIPTGHEPVLTEEDRWIGLLGTGEFGPIHMGVGPAVGFVGFDWTEGPLCLNSCPGPVSSHATRVGALAELAFTAPLGIRPRPRVDVRYLLTSSATVPAFEGAGPFDVPLKRMVVAVGLTYSFR